MRQQLITWLIEDIAPEIRRSRDAAGTIIKFANENNLAPALVQGLGQLYNTAKTLAFLEKAGNTGRGDSFPILDVDDLVKKFLEDSPSKSAGVAQGTIDNWEFDNPDGHSQDLPACFAGIMTPAFQEEKVIETVPPTSAKVAALKKAATKLEIEFSIQVFKDTRAEMEKNAGAIARILRENPDYSFTQMEADALGYFSDNPRIKGVMDKVAEYCGNCFPRVHVERAKSATKAELLRQPAEGLMALIGAVDDGFYTLQACEDFRKEAAGPDTTYEEPEVYDASQTHKPPTVGVRRPEDAFGASRPKWNPTPKPSEDAGVGQKSPRKLNNGKQDGKQDRKSESLFDRLNARLDKIIGTDKMPSVSDVMTPGIKDMFGGRNIDQELVDADMQDTRHLAVLQNLLTTDAVLAEVDPERVVDIYNTVRQSAPEIAGDTNVMRVLLRSAVQHDGIAPFDLQAILETELAKQKVDWNRRLEGDAEYAGAKAPVPNKPM